MSVLVTSIGRQWTGLQMSGVGSVWITEVSCFGHPDQGVRDEIGLWIMNWEYQDKSEEKACLLGCDRYSLL